MRLDYYLDRNSPEYIPPDGDSPKIQRSTLETKLKTRWTYSSGASGVGEKQVGGGKKKSEILPSSRESPL